MSGEYVIAIVFALCNLSVCLSLNGIAHAIREHGRKP